MVGAAMVVDARVVVGINVASFFLADTAVVGVVVFLVLLLML